MDKPISCVRSAHRMLLLVSLMGAFAMVDLYGLMLSVPREGPIETMEARHSRGRLMPLIAPSQSESKTTPVHQEFAAVSIKENAPGSRVPTWFKCQGADGTRQVFDGSNMTNQFVVPRGRCVGSGVYLPDLIGFAYNVSRSYISGGPDWTRDATFQIEAAVDDVSTTTLDDFNQMLQTLLADRFKLKVRRAKKESQGYILVLGRSGPKMMQSPGDEEPPWPIPNARGQITIKGRSDLDKFAHVLTRLSAIFSASHETQPVVDKTGLTGRYEYEFVLPDQPAQAGGRGAYQPDASQISKALEEQLGLRLQAEKVPVEAIVIDQIERPSPN